jgi:hypothetical protein
MFSLWPKIIVSVAAYGFAFSLAVAAAVPGLNFLYSGHGGLAWLLLPFALPTAIGVLFFFYATAAGPQKPSVGRFAIASVCLYAPVSLLASHLGAYSIRATFGLAVSPLKMWALFMSPFGLPFAF